MKLLGRSQTHGTGENNKTQVIKTKPLDQIYHKNIKLFPKKERFLRSEKGTANNRTIIDESLIIIIEKHPLSPTRAFENHIVFIGSS